MRRPRGDTQEKILEFIKQEIREKGYPPSVREICEAVSLKSTSTVHGHLQRLEKKGLLHRDDMKPRAIEVLAGKERETENIVSVPVIGEVAAGVPIPAEQEFIEEMPLPESFVGSGEHFILNVRGTSMIDAGIRDGDMVVVRRQQTADNGEIVVAMIDGEATVKRFFRTEQLWDFLAKRFFREDGHFRLQPENETMEPIIVDDVIILGKVTALLRQY